MLNKKERKFIKLATITAISLVLTGLTITSSNAAATYVSLGKEDKFAIIAGRGITNSGQSLVTGDLASLLAQSAKVAAYNFAAAETPSARLQLN